MKKFTVIFVAVLVTVSFYSGMVLDFADNSISLQQTYASSKKIGNKTTKLVNSEEKLKNRIEPLAKAYAKQGGDYSVYVYSLKNKESYIYNNHPMVSASMIKMFILAKAYEEISKGRLSEKETITLKRSDVVGGAGNIQGMALGTKLSIGYLLRQMIVESDNVATNLMIKRLGMSNINAYIQKHGYTDTKLQRLMMDFTAQRNGRENYSSVNDLGKIFKLLYEHKCVNKEMDEKMLSILLGQTDNDKIPRGVPSGTKIAHKTGELVGVYNDGGIVYSNKGDYVLVVLANKVGGEAIGRIGNISRTVYNAL